MSWKCPCTGCAKARKDERAQVIREIEAFASEYSHLIEGRDVVIVEQLTEFLRSKK
jgi:hypothetical protein